MNLQVIGRLGGIALAGMLAHLLDWPVRRLRNGRIRRFSRYAIGVICVMPLFLYKLEHLLQEQGEALTPARVLQLAAAAYIEAFTSFGLGVVMGHVVEQFVADQAP